MQTPARARARWLNMGCPCGGGSGSFGVRRQFAAVTVWLVSLPCVAVMDCGDPSPLWLFFLLAARLTSRKKGRAAKHRRSPQQPQPNEPDHLKEAARLESNLSKGRRKRNRRRQLTP